jgi:hypothetical protein
MQAAVQHKPVILPRVTQRTHRLIGFILVLLVTSGCATVDEADQYERADARIRALEQFEALQHACRASGGVVVYEGGWGRVWQPTAMDLRMASCAMRLGR